MDRKIITIFVILNKKMSKIKELKKKEQNNINLIELYQKIVVNEKTKYVELFETLIKHKFETSFSKEKMTYHIKNLVPDFNEEGLNTFDILMSSFIVDHVGEDYVKNFTRFVAYNERGLIDNNDVTTYKNFDQICKEVNKADLKDLSKSLSKQVITLLNDDEWVVIKPLTYESSKKYGSNTKWCTTAANDPQYFYKYFRNGVLTYCLNKKTGYKIAVYKGLNESVVTFWNQEDQSIDSFGSELPTEIISLLRKEYNDCKKSNFALSDQEFVEKEMALNGVVYRGRTARGNVRVGNQFDGEQPEQPEEEGPGDFDLGLGPEDFGLEDEDVGAQMGVDIEDEIINVLEREIAEENVDRVERRFRVRMDRALMDRELNNNTLATGFLREIDTDEEIPEVHLELEERVIGSNMVGRFREVDFDEIPVAATAFLGNEAARESFEAALHHGYELRDGMPVGRMVTEEVLNGRREEFLDMARHNGEQIRQAVQEIRNERTR